MKLEYRPVTMEDADMLLQWKNQAATRKYSIVTHDFIKRESHIKWLEQKLASTTTDFLIVLLGGVPIGDVRIEWDQPPDISLRITEECWSKGIGTQIIKDHSAPGMTAKIVEGNLASMRVFIRSGYEPISYDEEKKFYTYRL